MTVTIFISSCLLILFLCSFLNEYIKEYVKLLKKLRGHFNRKYFGIFFKDDLYKYVIVMIIILFLVYITGYIITITIILLGVE